MSHISHATTLLGIAIVLASCGGPDARRAAFTRDLVALETEAAVGRHGEAVARSEAMLAVARGPRESCPVLVARARSLAGLHREADALDAYRQIAGACAEAPQESSIAMLHLGRWIAGSGRPPEAALPVLEALVLTFPDEPAARQAVAWIRDLSLPGSGPDGTAARLAALADRVPGNGAVVANLRYEAGVLLRDAAVDDAGRQRALALFDRVIAEHPLHGLGNDALMARARILRATGRPGDAVVALESLLARREWSFLIGSYEVDLYREASGLLPEVAREAGEPGSEVARREREHRKRYPR